MLAPSEQTEPTCVKLSDLGVAFNISDASIAFVLIDFGALLTPSVFGVLFVILRSRCFGSPRLNAASL